jgi:ABC-2 type transport system permease protein
VIMYPMLAVCGIFAPIAVLPPPLRILAKADPLTYAVSLLAGMWKGDAWAAHLGDLAALAVVFAAFTALSAKVFRWE